VFRIVPPLISSVSNRGVAAPVPVIRIAPFPPDALISASPSIITLPVLEITTVLLAAILPLFEIVPPVIFTFPVPSWVSTELADDNVPPNMLSVPEPEK